MSADEALVDGDMGDVLTLPKQTRIARKVIVFKTNSLAFRDWSRNPLAFSIFATALHQSGFRQKLLKEREGLRLTPRTPRPGRAHDSARPSTRCTAVVECLVASQEWRCRRRSHCEHERVQFSPAKAVPTGVGDEIISLARVNLLR